jgi:DNA processing protein
MTSPADFDPETRARLALHLIPGIGVHLAKALIERFGSAEKALEATVDELRTVPRLGIERAQQVASAAHEANLAKELALLDKHQVALVPLGAPEYPSGLASISNPPAFLYVRGALAAKDARAIAIVGARSCTEYGKRTAERLASGLARAGYTIISGLAYGIDAVAHRTALAGGGRTLAVLAGGLSKIYPAEHAELAEQITTAGALLSEASMAQPPLPTMFPARNRIISGLSLGVIVVEAGERSGALITAEHALRQGRKVFAVPGPVDSEASRGTLRLLKKGAILVRDIDDVVGVLDPAAAAMRQAPATGIPCASPPPPQPCMVLSGKQKKVYELLAGGPVHADEIVQQSGLTVGETGHALVMLELQGVVRRLPGNRFERKA